MVEIAFPIFSFLFLYSLFPEYKTAALTLWPFFFAWGWLKWFCRAKLNIPFSLDLFNFLPHARTFADSIRYLKIHRTLLFTLPIFALSFLLVKPSMIWFSFWLLSAILRFPNRRKKSPVPAYEWSFPTEDSLPIDPKFPLLRHTLAFTGNKQLQIDRGKKPHVIMIFLESFRAKNIGCLGGNPSASPQFDRLAEEGALFTQFYANGLQTQRAMLSSFFGIPGHLKTMSLQPFCSIPMIGLPEILKKNGYDTAFFQGSPSTFDWSFPFLHKAGFEMIRGREHFPTEQKTSWGVLDEVLFQSAADWLEKQTLPTFLSLFTITNHHPWESPLKFSIPGNFPEAYRRYLQTFAYSDHCLGLFIERLKQSGILDKSIVFILGDHGQEMGERKGTFAIHNDLYQENIHIPLLILGGPKATINDPASQVDLLPTILDLLNIKATHHSVGRSLLREQQAPVFITMPRQEPLIASINGQHKLILGKKDEFYDLHEDPNEQKKIPVPDELKEQTQSYFQSIEELYTRSAWAPESLEPPSAILDLSHTPNIFTPPKQQGLHFHECNFSYAPFLTDDALNWIANNCPNLSILNAPGCPLITQEGLAAVINKCTSLRSLNIEGHSGITDIPIEKETALEALHLKNCPLLDGDALTRIVRHCPRLIYLAASLEKTKDCHLHNFDLRQINFLWLENGTSITDDALNAFLNTNPDLTILILENFPNIKRIDLQKFRRLHTLKFANCPNLTDETLEGLTLRDLALIDCPKITRTANSFLNG
jgi:arylsulfatase A-like enzyme